MYVISHNNTKIKDSHKMMMILKDDLYDSLPVEKALTFHNFIILIKLVWNKDKNNYYYNIFLEIGLYQPPKNNDNKIVCRL